MSPEQKPPATPPVRSLEEDIEAISVEEIADPLADRLEDRDSLHAHASWFSGPVPPPGHMKEYAEIDPSFPDRFLAMAEKQQAHDQAVEKDIIATNTKIVSEYQVLEKRGQTLGFILAAAGLIAGVVTSVLGAPLAGGIIGTGGLAILAGVFVYGARKNVASSQLLSPATEELPPPKDEMDAEYPERGQSPGPRPRRA